jgi:hypothetical protein
MFMHSGSAISHAVGSVGEELKLRIKCMPSSVFV